MRYLLVSIVTVSLFLAPACSKSKSKSVDTGLLEVMALCSADGVIAPASSGVGLSPSGSWQVYPGQSLTVSASPGVSWSVSPGTLLSITSSDASSITCSAAGPGSGNPPGVETITATSLADSAKTATLTVTIIPDAGANVHLIEVNGGPVPGQPYPNAPFTSITICEPGTLNCQTIGGILVDTGSYGLRVIASQINAGVLSSLPRESGGGGTVNNCAKFADGSFLWGEVARADLTMGGETASGTPIQLVADPGGFQIPSACSGGGVNSNTQAALGANGILGVGLQEQDCGSYCASNSNAGIYYECSGSGCQPAAVAIAGQVTNPVAKFASDNNGVILELQSVSGMVPGASGSMIFGIGTRANNQLGTAVPYALDLNGFFITTINCRTMTGSFIDSGSNGLFFNSSIPQCGGTNAGWYCPASTIVKKAVTMAADRSVKSTVVFSVANADALLINLGTDEAFSSLGGAGFTGSFDWGLPFFFGRNVFTAISGKSTPAGTGPYWAY